MKYLAGGFAVFLEGKSSALLLSLIMFGLPALILLAVAW